MIAKNQMEPREKAQSMIRMPLLQRKEHWDINADFVGAQAIKVWYTMNQSCAHGVISDCVVLRIQRKNCKTRGERVKLLVVEDARDMNRLIVKTLKKSGYSVDSCFDGEEALTYLLGAEYDAMILDVMMPKMDGYTLLEHIRNKNMDLPVLFLTARDAVADRVKGLDLGADDYLVKPFDFEELLARVRAMTRKRTGSRSNVYTLADLTVDTLRRTVRRGDAEIALLPKEFAILEYMIRNQGTVLSREQLENQIWNYEYSGNSNNMDVYISRLRKKLDSGQTVKLLHTIRGVGWVLRADETEHTP